MISWWTLWIWVAVGICGAVAGWSQDPATTETSAPVQNDTAPEPAPAPLFEIRSCSPSELFLGAGGDSRVVIIRGMGLEKLRGARVFRDNKPVSSVLARFTDSGEGQRNLVLLASEAVPQGGGYRVAAGLDNGETRWIPVQVTVVAAGDPRARALTVEDLAKPNPGMTTQKVVTIDAETLPQVTSTVPSALRLVAGGGNHVFLLQGRNLDKVTEMRLRLSSKPPVYSGKTGVLPFEKTPHGLRLQIRSSRPQDAGQSYTLDLLVGKYIATSLTFEVEKSP